MSPLPALTPQQAEKAAGLDPVFQPLALQHRALVLSEGIPFLFNETIRSSSQQAQMFQEGKGPGVAPGKSKHEIGFAYDFAGPRTDDEWRRAGELAESLGLEWGGRYAKPERWHVEQPDARAQLAAYRALKVAAVASIVGLSFWAVGRGVRASGE